MTRRRSIVRGGTDYTGVSLEDIFEHLKDWRVSTEELLRNLKKHKFKVIENKYKIEMADAVISFIDASIDIFNRFLYDFDRILAELPSQVTESHIEIISQILRGSEFHENYCVRFDQDHIEKSLRDESMRPLLDAIYADTRDEIINYSDLSNVMPRLRTYIGSGLKKSGRRISADDIEAFELKPNLFGIGLNLNYIIKKVKRLFAKKRA